MKTVSIEPLKSQTVSVQLGGQQCELRLIQRPSAIYLDLTVNGNPIMQGVPCYYGNKLVRYRYLGFLGDLVFLDNAGTNDPQWDGLGIRYQLFYLEEGEIV
ncbi:phage baseplate plug family protein [Aeromonas hydrophila]|uniref:phage baseplate plug family protein n=1 Tax=Aeromonas hydrophila TaxID=644 RepID=UPI003B63A82F